MNGSLAGGNCSSAVSKVIDPVRLSPDLNASLADLIASVTAAGSRRNRTETHGHPVLARPALRRLAENEDYRGQEFVIGGYTPSRKNFDAVIFGYYEGNRLIYVARTRNGFYAALQRGTVRPFCGHKIAECPFVNRPGTDERPLGKGIAAAKMADCRSLKPVLVGQFEFVELTSDNHLRHSRFLGLCGNKKARDVNKEG